MRITSTSSASIRVQLQCLFVSLALAGCASDQPQNPSFPLSTKLAHAEIAEMRSDPMPLPRPVIVLGGIHDPGLVGSHIADVIRNTVIDRTQVFDVSFFETWSFDSCADKLIRKIDERYPNVDSSQTTEVDVVGFSMGGLVARYAASDAYAAKRGRQLHMSRLFTISTPHLGADLADLPTLDKRVKDMRVGSAFLSTLNAQPHDYVMFTYVRLHDGVVGTKHAAPPGVTPWWLPRGFTLSHVLAGHDERILADILARLREQQPFSTEPAASLPEHDERK